MSSLFTALSSLLPSASGAARHLVGKAAAPASGQPATVAVPGDPLANEQTFLKLLVSQLQNQNPLNPTDSNQFVSQLTSYSQLEQLIGIRQNTTTASPPAATPPATAV